MPTSGSISNTEFSKREDTAASSGDVGAFVLAVRNDAAAVVTTTNGDYSQISVDSTGRVGITDLGGSITIDGTVTADTTFDYAEDIPHVSGDIGAFVLAVRNDAAVALTNTNGDYSPIATDSAGRVGISDLGGAISIDDNGGSITVDGTVAVTQSTSPWVVSGTVSNSEAKLEDAPHVSGDSGFAVWGVRNDAAAIRTNNDGDYSPISTDSVGRVGISDLGGSITIDGTVTADTNFDFAEDTPHVSGDIGAFVLAVRNDANAVLTNTNGDYSPIAVNSAGAVAISDGGNSITVDGTVAVTQSTSPWVTSLDAASLAALESITVQNGAGAAAVNIQDGGNSITVDGTVSISGTVTTGDNKVEDVPHVTADVGSFILGVRNDTAAVRTNTDGDYSPISTDSAGRVGISDLGGSISIDDNAGSITVDGTVAVTQSTSPWVTSLDAASLAALESITVQNGAGAAAVNIQDGGNSITVDGVVTADTNFDYAEDSAHTTGEIGAFVLAVRNDANAAMTNTNGDYSPIAVNANGAVAISDGGNSITVDGTVAVTQSTSPWVTSLDAASLAALESITVQNGAGAGAVNIQDGGNSITVDGAVTVSGTVATTSEKAEDVGHVTGAVGNFVLGVRNDAAATLTSTDLDYTPIATDAAGRIGISDLGGSVTVDGTVAATQSGAWTVAVNNAAGAAAVNIQDGGNSITVDGTVSITAGTARDDTDNQAPVATGLTTNVVRNYVYDGANWDRWTGAITDGGGSLTVDGTIAVTQSTSPWVTSLDAASLAALESITVQNGAGAAAVNIQDGGNSITVDGAVTVSGTVATNSERAEDSGHTTGNIGNFVLAVRNDAGTALATTDLDYIPFQTDANGDLRVAEQRVGTLANGAETAVAAAAVQVLAANANRKKMIIQNTGTANVRIGTTGLTATTGMRLIPSGSMIMEMPNCPTNAVFAIREGATSSTVLAQEVT